MTWRHRGQYAPLAWTFAVTATLGVLAGAELGCLGTSAFVCAADEACNLADDGRCEENGHCSYPDAGCPLGRRYADGGELGNSCVGGATGGGDSDSDSGTSPGTTTGTDTTTSSTGTSTSGEVTTGSTSSSGPDSGFVPAP